MKINLTKLLESQKITGIKGTTGFSGEPINPQSNDCYAFELEK